MTGVQTCALPIYVDYWSGTGNIGLVTDMVQLRYANYPKDYFMGMLPSSQYGSVSALPISTLSNFPNTAIVSPSSQAALVNTTGTSVALSAVGPGNNAQLRLIQISPHFQFVRQNISNVGKK